MTTANLLLDHALTLFAVRGYDAVGVQEIATAAGVTKPTLYHHFGNKQGLFRALLERDSRVFLTKLETATTYEPELGRNLEHNLTQLVRVYLSFAQTQPDFYRLLASSYLAPPESEPFRLTRPLHARQFDLLERLFEDATRDHGNMRGRARRYAYSFSGLVNTYLTLLLAGELELTGTLSYDIVQQFSHGIYS